MGEELPPRVRQQLTRVQQTRDSLQYVTALLLQVKQQLAETKNAQDQIKGLVAKSVIYQASGPLLFKTTKTKATKNLKDQVEALEDAEVVGDGGLGHVKEVDNVADAFLPLLQRDKDLLAGIVPERLAELDAIDGHSMLPNPLILRNTSI